MDLPGPGAGSTAIGHVADGLTSSAGQSLRAPVTGCYLGIDAALVPVAKTMRWGGVARLGGLVAALIAMVPVAIIALRLFPMVFVLRNAAIEVVVPFPITRATFVVPWGGEISAEASVILSYQGTYGGEEGWSEPPRGRQESPVRSLWSGGCAVISAHKSEAPGRRGKKNSRWNCDLEHCLAETARARRETKATDKNFIVDSE